MRRARLSETIVLRLTEPSPTADRTDISMNGVRGTWGNRRAATMIETLVVIAIIGVLLALLSPAILSSRQRALTMQCKGNLHQFGIASHHGRPIVMPLDANCATLVSTYRCPSDSGSALIAVSDNPELQARTNYAGVTGDGRLPGMGSHDSVTDGLSNTLELGEQDSQPVDPLKSRCGYPTASCERPPNARRPDGTKFTDGFRSVHPENGVNFLLADGAVRFISDGIDLTLYHALSTGQGGESTGGF